MPQHSLMALSIVGEGDEGLYSTAPEHNDKYIDLDHNPGLFDHGDDDAEPIPPLHPVPVMQAAFEESIAESYQSNSSSASPPNLSPIGADAETRRQKLLESTQYDDSWATRWHQRPTARHHPLLKLMAQIVFGMHLLHRRQAKSDDAVVRILQKHVNEVDTFLERTAEDFDLAIKDIDERIRFLKLPMAHMEVFEIMLEDKKFRAQLMGGNDKIERIIDRTTSAMNAALSDMHKGVEATKQLRRYIENVTDTWPRDERTVAEVFDAMRSNEKGWKRYLKDLQSMGKTLGHRLTRLAKLVEDMSRMAEDANSRRNKKPTVSSNKAESPSSSPGLRSKFSKTPSPPPINTSPRVPSRSLNKPLPQEPDPASSHGAIHKPHPVPFDQRFEQPRQSPRSPQSLDMKFPRADSFGKDSIPRPKTAGSTKRDTADLANFFRQANHSNPLRSNPPDNTPPVPNLTSKTKEKTLLRSRSQDAMSTLAASPIASPPAVRSVSQGAIDTMPRLRGASGSSLTAPSSKHSNAGDSVKLAAIPEQQNAMNSSGVNKMSTLPRNGFTRRFSKRMKHIQPMKTPTPTSQSPHHSKANSSSSGAPTTFSHDSFFSHTSPPLPPPSDSAYSSGTDRNPTSKNKKNKNSSGGRSSSKPPPYEAKQPPAIAIAIEPPPPSVPVVAPTNKFSSPLVPLLLPTPKSNPTPQLAVSPPPQAGVGEGYDQPTALLSVTSNRIAPRPQAQPAPSVRSIASTSASRRHISLRKIFHRRGDGGLGIVA